MMNFSAKWTRRGFMTGISSLTAMVLGARKLPAANLPAPFNDGSVKGFGQTGNVYDELGVTTVINGQGTMTYLGGSLIPPEVEAVMAEAGRHFVNIVELEEAAGKKIAAMLKLPQGYSAL